MSNEKTKRTFSAKAVAILMVLVLVLGGVMGGTMAWLVTNTDPVVNTFTYGDIDITLTESEGELADNDNDATTNRYEMVPGKVITKDPKVTVLANSEKNWLFAELVKSGGQPHNFDAFLTYAIADGWTLVPGTTDVYYRIVEETAADQVFPVLKGNAVTVKSDVTKEMVNALDTDPSNPTYPQLSITAYAVQYTATGDVAEAWGLAKGTGTVNVVTVTDAATLKSTIENATQPTTISLANGTYDIGQIAVTTGKNITINGSAAAVVEGQFKVSGKLTLNGITVDDPDAVVAGEVSQYSKSAIGLINSGDVVCNGVTFNQDFADSSAITAWWSTEDGANIECYNCVFNCAGQRPIRSDACVTVENCTFNDPYRYAVQMTSKSSTMAAEAEAYVNFKNNTINAGTTSSKPVYGVQLEGGYGCKDLTINGTGNTINLGTTGKDSAMYYCECGAVDHSTIVWNTEVAAVHEVTTP